MIENEKQKFKFNTDATSLVLLTATLLWMAFIFIMSSQTGEDSSFLSSSFSEGLMKFTNSIFGGNAPAKLLELIGDKHILRKAGHVFEYLVLGILVYSWIRRQGFREAREAQGTQEAQGAQEAGDTQVSSARSEAAQADGCRTQEARGPQKTQDSDSGDGTILSQEMSVRSRSGDPPSLPLETTTRTVPLLRRATVKKVMISILICVIYAATDELHQMLVPGRGSMIADTLLDGVSSAAGVLLTWAIARDWLIF